MARCGSRSPSLHQSHVGSRRSPGANSPMMMLSWHSYCLTHAEAASSAVAISGT